MFRKSDPPRQSLPRRVSMLRNSNDRLMYSNGSILSDNTDVHWSRRESQWWEQLGDEYTAPNNAVAFNDVDDDDDDQMKSVTVEEIIRIEMNDMENTENQRMNAPRLSASAAGVDYQVNRSQVTIMKRHSIVKARGQEDSEFSPTKSFLSIDDDDDNNVLQIVPAKKTKSLFKHRNHNKNDGKPMFESLLRNEVQEKSAAVEKSRNQLAVLSNSQDKLQESDYSLWNSPKPTKKYLFKKKQTPPVNYRKSVFAAALELSESEDSEDGEVSFAENKQVQEKSAAVEKSRNQLAVLSNSQDKLQESDYSLWNSPKPTKKYLFKKKQTPPVNYRKSVFAAALELSESEDSEDGEVSFAENKQPSRDAEMDSRATSNASLSNITGISNAAETLKRKNTKSKSLFRNRKEAENSKKISVFAQALQDSDSEDEEKDVPAAAAVALELPGSVDLEDGELSFVKNKQHSRDAEMESGATSNITGISNAAESLKRKATKSNNLFRNRKEAENSKKVSVFAQALQDSDTEDLGEDLPAELPVNEELAEKSMAKKRRLDPVSPLSVTSETINFDKWQYLASSTVMEGPSSPYTPVNKKRAATLRRVLSDKTAFQHIEASKLPEEDNVEKTRNETLKSKSRNNETSIKNDALKPNSRDVSLNGSRVTRSSKNVTANESVNKNNSTLKNKKIKGDASLAPREVTNLSLKDVSRSPLSQSEIDRQVMEEMLAKRTNPPVRRSVYHKNNSRDNSVIDDEAPTKDDKVDEQPIVLNVSRPIIVKGSTNLDALLNDISIPNKQVHTNDVEPAQDKNVSVKNNSVNKEKRVDEVVQNNASDKNNSISGNEKIVSKEMTDIPHKEIMDVGNSEDQGVDKLPHSIEINDELPQQEENVDKSMHKKNNSMVNKDGEDKLSQGVDRNVSKLMEEDRNIVDKPSQENDGNVDVELQEAEKSSDKVSQEIYENVGERPQDNERDGKSIQEEASIEKSLQEASEQKEENEPSEQEEENEPSVLEEENEPSVQEEDNGPSEQEEENEPSVLEEENEPSEQEEENEPSELEEENEISEQEEEIEPSEQEEENEVSEKEEENEISENEKENEASEQEEENEASEQEVDKEPSEQEVAEENNAENVNKDIEDEPSIENNGDNFDVEMPDANLDKLPQDKVQTVSEDHNAEKQNEEILNIISLNESSNKKGNTSKNLTNKSTDNSQSQEKRGILNTPSIVGTPRRSSSRINKSLLDYVSVTKRVSDASMKQNQSVPRYNATVEADNSRRVSSSGNDAAMNSMSVNKSSTLNIISYHTNDTMDQSSINQRRSVLINMTNATGPLDDVSMPSVEDNVFKVPGRPVPPKVLPEETKKYIEKLKAIAEDRKQKAKQFVKKMLEIPKVAYTFDVVEEDIGGVSKPKTASKFKKPNARPMKAAVNNSPTTKSDLLDGYTYKKPKLYMKEPWITPRLYKLVQKKMEPRYGLKALNRSEKFIKDLAFVVNHVSYGKKDSEKYLAVLKQEMARLQIVETHNDFYNFIRDFLPYFFRVKAIPAYGRDVPPLQYPLFDPIAY